MSKIHHLQAAPEPDIESTLTIVDDLRARIASGEIKAFTAVGITLHHETLMWAICTKKTTRLEMMGAIAHLQHCYHHGEPQ